MRLRVALCSNAGFGGQIAKEMEEDYGLRIGVDGPEAPEKRPHCFCMPGPSTPDSFDSKAVEDL